MSAAAPNKDAPDDASIPVLTERLTLPPLELDTTLPPEVPEPAAPRAAGPLALDTALPGLPSPPPPAPAPVRAAPAPPPPLPTSAPVFTPEAAAVSAAAGAHWTRIELELRSSILQAIADALPQQIDSIVRHRMNDAIERLFTQLVAETRLAVASSLRDIVDQAVRAELARLRALKR
jgi:hypothetical protein